MRRRTEARIRELAKAGRGPEAIAGELGVSPESVHRVLGLAAPPLAGASTPRPVAPASGSPPTPPAAGERRPLSELASGTRDSIARTADELRWQAETIQAAIRTALVGIDGRPRAFDPDVLRNMEVVQGIVVDKQAVALRLLRELEAETGEDLEAAFTIIEVDADGRRRIVSQPPELGELDDAHG